MSLHAPRSPFVLEYEKELNPQQLAVVRAKGGPLLVIAGAGSGKTRVVTYRVAYLIEKGVNPAHILLVTFTNKAAREMLRRVELLVPGSLGIGTRVWGGTFHHIGNRILRRHAPLVGFQPNFTILDREDAGRLLETCIAELKLNPRGSRFPRAEVLEDIVGLSVNTQRPVEEIVLNRYPYFYELLDDIRAAAAHYRKRKKELNSLDFDDLLFYWKALLQEHPDVRARYGEQFRHILVDEYQDTNGLQAAILRGMAQGGARITAVGDDAQSIYSFRAATVRNMLDFPRHFPGAATVTLSQNYRSVMPILQTTNRLIAQARERYTKDLWSARAEGQPPRLVTCRDEAEQDAYIVRRVLEHREQGIALRRQAVLFRAAHLSDTLELELTRRRIPYHKYGGLRFLEAAHVKDLIAFLRLLENPRDEMAWFRALQLFECVGPATAGRALAHVAQHGHDPRALASFAAPPAARAGFAALAAAIEELSRFGAHQPAAQVERLRVFYEPLLARRYENPAARARDLEHLEQIASGYRTRRRFLTDLHLDPPASTSDLAGPPLRDEDWLVLSTIHSAKGGEWDVVYLIHAADGCLPSDMAAGSAEELEEELRLTYVALTRARDFLYVTWPLRYYHRHVRFTDRHSYAQLCRFFTPEVRAGMTAERAATEEEPDAAEAPARGGPDIAARVRARWD